MPSSLPPRPEPTPGSEEAYERYRRGELPLPELDLDPRERLLWKRQVRRAKLTQAVVLCWLLGSPFVVLPLIFGSLGPVWWMVAGIMAAVGIALGLLVIPVNVPMLYRPPGSGAGPNAYGVYDHRGPNGPRS